MRKLNAALLTGALLATATTSSVVAQDPVEPDDDEAAQILAVGGQVAPKSTAPPVVRPAGPNPYLALLPDPSVVDFAGWKRHVELRGDQRATRRQVVAPASPILADEDEPDGTRGGNDTLDTAQPIDGFGTRSRQNPKLRILGSLSPEPVEVEPIPPSTEDDGSIPLAADTGIGPDRDGIIAAGTVGDGPHGSTGSESGDFDFYALDAEYGDQIVVDIDTPVGALDSVVILYDDDGNFIAFNDDVDVVGGDSRLVHRVDQDGRFYVSVFGFPSFQLDPFDSASGLGAGSEGPYEVTITAGTGDDDVYAVQLRKGDVLGASVEGGATLMGFYDEGGTLVMGSAQDASFLYPPASPLPGGGNAVVDHVVDEDGWLFVGVSGGAGRYDVTVEAYRSPLDLRGPAQTIFLDFDGARVNTGIWGGPGVRTLSPLRAFMARWGLTNRDLNPLIDRIVDTVRENLARDMIASGLNPNFRLRVLNSRDHADPFGGDNVSRIIVGGTIAESGIGTIGIAQSIDPGNFAPEETALVLLDVLSDPPDPLGEEDPSLNAYITPASDRVAFVGRAIGNIVSHEAGHFSGDWHVDQFDEYANLMDQGGNFDVLFGVGPDGIGGTADDPDVDFGEDFFNPNEGFVGIEDTLSRLVFPLGR